MYALDKVERLTDSQPTRKHGDVRDKADILHEFVTLRARIASEDAELPLEMGQAENGLEQGRLAGNVGTNEPHYPARLDGKADAVHGGRGSVRFLQPLSFNHCCHFSRFPAS